MTADVVPLAPLRFARDDLGFIADTGHDGDRALARARPVPALNRDIGFDVVSLGPAVGRVAEGNIVVDRGHPHVQPGTAVIGDRIVPAPCGLDNAVDGRDYQARFVSFQHSGVLACRGLRRRSGRTRAECGLPFRHAQAEVLADVGRRVDPPRDLPEPCGQDRSRAHSQARDIARPAADDGDCGPALVVTPSVIGLGVLEEDQVAEAELGQPVLLDVGREAGLNVPIANQASAPSALADDLRGDLLDNGHFELSIDDPDLQLFQELGREAVDEDIREAANLEPEARGLDLEGISARQFVEDCLSEMNQDVSAELADDDTPLSPGLTPDYLDFISDRGVSEPGRSGAFVPFGLSGHAHGRPVASGPAEDLVPDLQVVVDPAHTDGHLGLSVPGHDVSARRLRLGDFTLYCRDQNLILIGCDLDLGRLFGRQARRSCHQA